FAADGKAADPLLGWRVAVTRLLHPMGEARPEEEPFKELQSRWNGRDLDPSFLLPLRDVDAFRTYALRRDLPAEWFDSPFFHTYYRPYGTVDAVWVGFPLNRDAHS